MLYLLDTDTCSYAIRCACATLDARLAAAKAGSLAVSAVTRAELIFGLEKRGNPRALSRRVHGFLDRVTVVSWDAAAADCFAELRATCPRTDRRKAVSGRLPRSYEHCSSTSNLSAPDWAYSSAAAIAIHK